ncbi:hypothetical protein ASPZODRAFT_60894 [Penicilliopsis zonata CBS 506.65]|uniref:ASST-domain-containing protein n=1 Tax=Penicilliopsis zonata CBS 506.65 TaxID=1073090 RepID=A0A1L9SPJ0_9EURO|nr:hypothetical protein ASPZODRAFT_60894 [Penicilliopsis zonata CBS 506.65]OJJ49013.1 hypothetical protein ASPZODRAFT_60894 [Penicilliopsis zonata CBS 506.65]
MLVSPVLVAFTTLCSLTTFTLVAADIPAYHESADYDRGLKGSWPHQYYRSAPEVGPVINYRQHDERCDDGQYTLIAPRGGGVTTAGPMILDQKGALVWTKPYGQTYNVNIYNFKGRDYLTFWTGNDGVVGHGDGVYYMLDSSYNVAYTIKAANGLPADLHEFQITPNGTAIFTIYDIIAADLSSVGGSADGWIWDGTFQEVDIETGELVFQWRASEHFNFTEAYRGREGNGDRREQAWDYFHINSIDKDDRGNYLISSRYFHVLAYIDGRTGAVIWKLGGKDNMFTDLSDGAATNISWQHHARFHKDGHAITVFDNGSRGQGAPMNPSRGLFIDIDHESLTAKVRHQYWNPLPISSQSQGSVQILDSGNVLVGYGFSAAWTEFTMDGEVLCDIHFGPTLGFSDGSIISYRVFKHAWVGDPNTNPAIALEGYEIYVSWNGATEVKTWVLQGSDIDDGDDDEEEEEEGDNFHFISAVAKDGFETTIPIPTDTTYTYLRALALNSTGHTIGTTVAMEWDSSGVQVLMGVVDDKAKEKARRRSMKAWVFFAVGFGSASLLAFCSWLIGFCVRRARAKKRARASAAAGGTAWQAADFDLNDLVVEDDDDDDMEHVGADFALLRKKDWVDGDDGEEADELGRQLQEDEEEGDESRVLLQKETV